jgi:hypothetical protein
LWKLKQLQASRGEAKDHVAPATRGGDIECEEGGRRRKGGEREGGRREGGAPALSPTESGMKREGSEVLERKEARSWLARMAGTCIKKIRCFFPTLCHHVHYR